MRSKKSSVVFLVLVILIITFIAYSIIRNKNSPISKNDQVSVPTNHGNSNLSKGVNDNNSSKSVDETKINTQEFIDLGSYHIKNGIVYCRDDKLLLGADADTFVDAGDNEINKNIFYYDKNSVYPGIRFSDDYCKKLENSDGKTFKLISQNFAKDNNQVYYHSWTMGGDILIILDSLDLGSVKVVSENVIKDKFNVYHVDWDGVIVIEKADPESTIGISKSFFIKDKNSVFYRDTQIQNADASSFKLIEIEDTPVNYTDAKYAKDENRVYYCNKECNVVDNADVSTFKLIKDSDGTYYGNGDIAVDSNKIYSRGMMIKGSDPKTFNILNMEKASDKNNSYTMWCHMDGCRLEIIAE